jgi:nucleoside phosphorylase
MELGVVVLVPQGAECQAVKRGLRRERQAEVMAIPAGLEPVQNWLAKQADLRSVDRVIVMGLCGGLRDDLAIGDAVVYTSCQNFAQQSWQCKVVSFGNAKSVKAISSNKIIATPQEKRFIREKYGCDVVDMEGTAILAFFAALNIPVTMLRVVSDDAAGDIPDLSAAIDPNGKLQGRQLAIGLIKEPRKGLRLLRGAIVGLRALAKLAGSIGGFGSAQPPIDG